MLFHALLLSLLLELSTASPIATVLPHISTSTSAADFALLTNRIGCSNGHCETRPQSRKFNRPPCDVKTDLYCTKPGSIYPTRALRQFVGNNPDLMKRMHGNLRHSSALKTEMESNSVREESFTAERVISSAAASTNNQTANITSNLDNWTNSNLTTSSTMSPTTTSSSTMPPTTTSSSSMPPTTTSSSTMPPTTTSSITTSSTTTSSTTTSSTTTSSTTTSSTTTSSTTTSSTTTSSTTTASTTTSSTTTASTTTASTTTASTTTASSTMPPTTTSSSTTSSTTMSSSTIKSRNHSANLPGITTAEKGINPCPIRQEVVAPYWAVNTHGKTLAIVNDPPYEQHIHWEKCLNEHQPMLCRDGCRCHQEYRLQRLLAYDPACERKGVFMDWFRLPSYCGCRCHGLTYKQHGLNSTATKDWQTTE